jgi:hypothetical protein
MYAVRSVHSVALVVHSAVSAEQSRAEQSRAEAYCRQSAGRVNPGIGARWDPWPYICWMSRCP